MEITIWFGLSLFSTKKKWEIFRFLIRHHWQTKDSKLRTEDWRFERSWKQSQQRILHSVEKFLSFVLSSDSLFAIRYSLLTLCHLLWWRSMLFLLNMKNIILLFFSDEKCWRKRWWWWFGILNIASSAPHCICNEDLNEEWRTKA